MDANTSSDDAIPTTVTDYSVRPRRGDGVEVRTEAEEDGTHVLFEPTQENVYMLNASGRVLLDLCDGTRTIADIIAEVRTLYSVPEGIDLAESILAFLRTMTAAHAITLS